MYAIRLFEEALYRAFMFETMPGTMHQAIGMEATSAGVGHALRPDDVMTSTHRGHGHAIIKGLSLRSLMAEMYAKSTGASKGMGGSMHIFDLEHGFLGTTGVVGAGVPIGTGAALALKLEGRGRIAVSFFGDGGANQGAVHEALNLAAVWKLPIIFVCENNGYAVSMPVSEAFAIKQIAERAAGYGMPGMTVDGNDVLAVYDAAMVAADRARGGGGPTLLECVTYRFKGHSRFEPGAYRPEGELEAWMVKDPIPRLRKVLEDEGMLGADEADAIKDEVEREVDDAIELAKASPDADPHQIASFVFA
jgi:TPP-dependent pyruvate/acetoin dehydrogenase alpha subunit